MNKPSKNMALTEGEPVVIPLENTPVIEKVNLQSFRHWAAELNTPDWQVVGVMAQEKWAEGFETTKAAFTKALETMLNTELR